MRCDVVVTYVDVYYKYVLYIYIYIYIYISRSTYINSFILINNYINNSFQLPWVLNFNSYINIYSLDLFMVFIFIKLNQIRWSL